MTAKTVASDIPACQAIFVIVTFMPGFFEIHKYQVNRRTVVTSMRMIAARQEKKMVRAHSFLQRRATNGRPMD